jgi:hypothetical protein
MTRRPARIRPAFVVVALIASACGASSRPAAGDDDTPPPDAAIDAPPDSTPDPAPPPLDALHASIDLGVVEIGHSGSADVELINSSTTAITLDPNAFSITLGFSITSTDCVSLEPSATCALTIEYDPTQLGAAHGTLTIPSSANTVTVALQATPAHRVTVELLGDGAVASTPAGIACPGACSALFADAVTLTATAGATGTFMGWQPACTSTAGATSCDVAATTGAQTVTALFKQPTATIAVSVAGGSHGLTYIVDDEDGTTVPCVDACTTTVTLGSHVTLWGFTPSTFAGWSGGCVSAGNDCELVADADVAATVTFDADPHEVATIFPRLPVTSLAFDPAGDLVVADAMGVSKLSPAGAPVWTFARSHARDLAVDAAGHIYAADDTTVFSLDAGGTLRWSTALVAAVNTNQSVQSVLAVSSDGHTLAVHQLTGAIVLDGADGSQRFPLVLLGKTDGLAVAPDGTIAIGVLSTSFPEQLDIKRFSSAGSALAELSPLFGDDDASLTYDQANDLCALTTGGEEAAVSVTDPSLNPRFTNLSDLEINPAPAAAISTDPGNDVVIARGNQLQAASTFGLFIQVFAPDGSTVWTLDKPPIDTPSTPLVSDGVDPAAFAADGNFHVAVGGTYDLSQPWIQVLSTKPGP